MDLRMNATTQTHRRRFVFPKLSVTFRPQQALWAGSCMRRSLHALEHDAEALQTHETELASAERTVALTQQGYRVRHAGILQVVTAEREQQLAQIGVVQARTQRVVDTVGLFLASGIGV
jgi:outer membrane protein TolC